MGISSLPTRTEESLGLEKSNARPIEDPATELSAEEYNRLADHVVEIAETVGLEDGSTEGSIEQRLQAIENGGGGGGGEPSYEDGPVWPWYSVWPNTPFRTVVGTAGKYSGSWYLDNKATHPMIHETLEWDADREEVTIYFTERFYDYPHVSVSPVYSESVGGFIYPETPSVRSNNFSVRFRNAAGELMDPPNNTEFTFVVQGLLTREQARDYNDREYYAVEP